MDMRKFWKPAARILGGFEGETASASELFWQDVQPCLHLILTIVKCVKLSVQARWKMFRAVELSVRWKFMATHPAITCFHAKAVDESIFNAVLELCRPDATPTTNSRMLHYLPQASGGLGFVCFEQHSSELYEIASMQSPWPPLKPELDEESLIQRPAGPREATKVLHDKIIASVSTFGDMSTHEFRAREDAFTPWFEISHVMKHLKISDDAWRLSMSNFLRCIVEYPACSQHDPTFDNSQSCHRCGGPYRTPRHQRGVASFISSCAAFGIHATSHFFYALGVSSQAKRPDILVYRNVSDAKPLALDFTVPHQSAHLDYNAVLKSYNLKANKYKDWRSEVVEFSPLVFSTFHQVYPKSFDTVTGLGPLAVSKGFARDCISRIKVALVNYEEIRFNALTARKNAGRLDLDPSMEDSE